MNVRIETGSLTIGLSANFIEPTIKVEISSNVEHVLLLTWTCFILPSVSVNGHSISAINPELILTGGTTTLAMA